MKGARCEPARAGTTARCLQRCLKLTNPNLDPVLPVRGLDRGLAHAPSPSLAPVLVLSHDQESAGLVLGLVRGPILHLITEKGTIRESTRTGISEVIIEDTGDRITSVAEIEGFIHGASITEEDMEITGQTGKIIARRIALVEEGHAPGHPREGLLHQGLEVILEILISHLLIGQGGLPLPGLPQIIAESSLPSVNLERRRNHLPRTPGHLRLQERIKAMSLRSSRFQEEQLKTQRHPRDQNHGKM